MPDTQASSTMQKPGAKPAGAASAEHHTKAAECCTKAAGEHKEAAKACVSGDHAKAGDHAKKADSHCSEAQDHGVKARAA